MANHKYIYNTNHDEIQTEFYIQYLIEQKRKKAQKASPKRSTASTFEEAMAYLSEYENDYIVAKTFMGTVVSGKTRMLFDLEKVDVENESITQSTGHTIRDVRQFVKEAYNSNPEGKVFFFELISGRIRIILDIKPADSPRKTNYRIHSFADINQDPVTPSIQCVGRKTILYDADSDIICPNIQLDQKASSYLDILFDNRSCQLMYYSLHYTFNKELDLCYDFIDEDSVREAIYYQGDEDLFIKEVFIRFISLESIFFLVDRIGPYVISGSCGKV